MIEVILVLVIYRDVIGILYSAYRIITHSNPAISLPNQALGTAVIVLAYSSLYLPEIVLIYFIHKQKLRAAQIYVSLYILGLLFMAITRMYKLSQLIAPTMVLCLVLYLYFKYKHLLD